MSDAPLAVFLHIPKTAGTSFGTFLTREFGRSRIVNVPDEVPGRDGGQYVLSCTPETLERLRLVRGHILHGIHAYFDRPVRYFTLLREPLSRIASFLNHMASEAALRPDVTTPWYEAVRHWNGTETIAAGGPQIDNYMVRTISGVRFDRGSCNADILARAIANLDTIASYGVYERLNESVCLIARDMGFRALPVLSRSKAGTPLRIHLTAEDKAFLADRNRYDLALYDYAWRRVDARLATEPSIVRRSTIYRRLTPVASGVEKALRGALALTGR